MLVIHACWLPDSSAGIWAEDSEKTVTSTSQAMQRARPHPFAAGHDQLAAFIEGVPDVAELLLPSVRRAPCDSPEMVRVTPRRQARVSLLRWDTPVIRVAAAEELAALAGQLAEQSLDARLSASARFLMELADYAADLVERGRVLPDLLWRGEAAEARWRAVLTGPDVAIVHGLISAMPHSLRAAEPESHPVALARRGLDAMVDGLMRGRLPASLLPRRRGRAPAVRPAVEAWLEALVAADAAIDASPDRVAELEEQLQPWLAYAQEDPGEAQLVLRLGDPRTTPDPEEEEPDWRVEFLLRSRSDPSLLVDAERIWNDDGALGRWLERPREALLSELARAQQVYPGLEAGLRQARPESLGIGTEDAYQFLLAAPALTEAGIEVLLPAWWGRNSRLGLRAHASPSDTGESDGRFSREQLCDFRWELAVGEHGLTEEEIHALADAKAPLVRLRGQWVAVDQDQLRRALAFLEPQKGQRTRAGDVISLALAHPDDADLPVPLAEVRADGWLGELLAGTAAETMSEAAHPEGLAATLRPYQARGLGWLSFLGRLGAGACLADDMGLGKTVQLLAAEVAARGPVPETHGGVDRTHRPTLLLCPMSLISNWEAEAARFTPSLRVIALHGAGRPRGEALTAALADADLVVTTYATALGDMDELAEVEWERVVLDEAQAIKNRLSRTANAVRRLKADQRIALTGTPVENRLTELWSIMDFVNPGILGSPEAFRRRFANPIERQHDDEAAALLRRITRPYILRRLKTDPAIITDLPEKIEVRQPYRLTVEQASLYQSVVEEMMRRIETTDGIERRGNVLAAMTKLKQVCNHPAQLLHDQSAIGRRSGKLIRLEEILEEILAADDKVLCFTQYTEFAELLVPHLAARFDTDVTCLSGSTSRERRREMVESFQSGAGSPIFVLSLKAGGTGLNLTAANHVVHLDRWWNPAVENQATDRAFRIGQRKRVQVHKFVGTGTLEERIDQMIEEKKALASMAVGDGEAWLTELSTDQLRDLFALSKEAVGE